MLEGIRVLDVATLAAAPLAATYLGEHGADVIKVEQPQGGDPLRHWGAQKDGIGVVWKTVSRNKRSVAVDLRGEEGQELVRRLAAECDVVIFNARPRTLEKWGLDYPRLKERNAGLVMVHVTGFGLTGPKANAPGFGTLAEAMSGFAHITGEEDGPPTLPPFMLADTVASLHTAYAVMMALYHRDVHGAEGQLIDVSLLEPLARLLEQMPVTYDGTGQSLSRGGNRWDIAAPRNAYRTSDDRWIAMSSSAPALATRVMRAVGRDDLADEIDFADAQQRLDRAIEVDDVVAAWVADRTMEEAMGVFDEAQVAAAPVCDTEQLLADEQVQARAMYHRVDDDELGSLLVQAPVPRFSGQEGRIDHLGPALGAHTDEVLQEILGIDSADLRSRGVVA